MGKNTDKIFNDIYSSRSGRSSRRAQHKWEEKNRKLKERHNKYKGTSGKESAKVINTSLTDQTMAPVNYDPQVGGVARVRPEHMESVTPDLDDKELTPAQQNKNNGMQPLRLIEVNPEDSSSIPALQIGGEVQMGNFGQGSLDTDGNTNHSRLTTYQALGADGLPTAGRQIDSAKGAFAAGASGNLLPSPEPPPAAPNSDPPPPNFLDKVWAAFGRTLDPDLPEGTVKLVGVRNPATATNANSFTDMLYISVKTNGQWVTNGYVATTTPGGGVLQEGQASNPRGTAVMAAPQFLKETYKLRNHGKKNPYLALGQSRRVYVWRDFNGDGLPDNEAGANIGLESGYFGINIHRAGAKHKASDNKPISGGAGAGTVYYKDANGNVVEKQTKGYSYSHGCQVFAGADDFEYMVTALQMDNFNNGVTYFDYVILTKNDFDNIKNGVDISDFIKKREEYYKANATKIKPGK